MAYALDLEKLDLQDRFTRADLLVAAKGTSFHQARWNPRLPHISSNRNRFKEICRFQSATASFARLKRRAAL
ncbi:hypothetical protein ACCS96_14850 [Rhizobium ruizarguesonis]|jgi:hypothetical protein